jgi:phosphoribosylformimino-5-aminoimidazole carboxamide ribotide isomerase
MTVPLIPSMDLLGGRIVRLRHGDRDQATFFDLAPEAWIERLAEAGATRIHLVDLDGAFGEARQKAFARYPSHFPGVRFQVGGGLRSRDAIQDVLDLGMDAVVGTLAIEQPKALVGLDPWRVIAALDLKDQRLVVRGWTQASACEDTDVFESLLTFGFKRALVTDVGRDGTLEGPGLEALRLVAKEGFEVQASGGLRDLADLGTLAEIPGVVGAISGKALLEGRIDLADPATRAALKGAA